MNLLSLSWKNIWANPLAFALHLSLFGLGVGVITLVLLTQQQLQAHFDNNLASVDLVIGAKGSPLQMVLCNMYHTDAPTGNIRVGDIRPFLAPNHPIIQSALPISVGDSYRDHRLVGTNPEVVAWYNATLSAGQLWKGDFEVVAGAVAARQIGLKLGDTFESDHGFAAGGELGHDDHHPLRVVGVLHPTGTVIDRLLLVSTATLWRLHGADTLPATLTDAPDDAAITALLVKYKGVNMQSLRFQRIINENTPLQAASPAFEINRLYDHALFRTSKTVLQAIGWTMVGVAAFSLFIALLAALHDRRYELALLRVMGASPRTVFALLLTEGLLLAAMGWAVGALLGHIGMEILARTLHADYGNSFGGAQWAAGEWWLLPATAVVGIAAAALPAWRAMRIPIADTLAGE